MADAIETQDVALDNNGGSEGSEQETTQDTPQKSRREIELELDLERTKAEAAKYKRIATREKNKHEREADDEDQKTEAPQNKSDAFALSQKSFLRAAGISAPDEVELALKTAKKWGMEVDEVVDDEDFKVKLDRLRTDKSNAAATSNIKSGNGSSNAKQSPEYYIARGTPPTRDEVPDRKTRASIARAMVDAGKNSKKFYND